MTRNKTAVLVVLVITLLVAVAPVAASWGPRTYTVIEKVCFTDNPLIAKYAFVDMSAVGVNDAAFNGGTLLVSQLEDGVKEYGYYTPEGGYQTLGWGWMVDDEAFYSALEGGGVSLEQLTTFMTSVQDELRNNCTEVKVEREFHDAW